MAGKSVEIAFDDLAVVRTRERLPVRAIERDDHIHGLLAITVQGRRLPHLGYFGENDVCFSEWLEQLAGIRAALSGASPARYVFDEGEQGQPAYVFELDGDQAFVTIADAEFSGGVADPEWQRVAFSPAEFVAECDAFRRQFIEHLLATAPQTGEEWLQEHRIRA